MTTNEQPTAPTEMSEEESRAYLRSWAAGHTMNEAQLLIAFWTLRKEIERVAWASPTAPEPVA